MATKKVIAWRLPREPGTTYDVLLCARCGWPVARRDARVTPVYAGEACFDYDKPSCECCGAFINEADWHKPA